MEHAYTHVRHPRYRARAARALDRTHVVWDTAAGYGSTVVLAGEWIVHTAEGPVLAVDDRTFRRCYRVVREGVADSGPS